MCSARVKSGAKMMMTVSVERHARPAGLLMRPTQCRRSGLVLRQAIIYLVVVCLAGSGIYYYIKQRALAQTAVQNLRLIYMALEWYELDQGHLPDLAFFPDEPRHDNDSLLAVLSRYGITEDLTVCPTAPAVLRELGLNYVWNVELNGQKLQEQATRRWMLASMHVLSDRVPAPHLGRYAILYTDGKVELSRTPPPSLRPL